MDALTTPNKTLFLSYSRKQTTWCDDLYTAIDTYTQYQRWRDNKIPESADWWDSICLNIEGCFAFVAILTQDYVDSVYCIGELEYALKLKKPVIALLLEEVEYPAALSEQRLQFARVNDLEITQVITKVLNACNQITLGYMQDVYSTDIHPRKHLRPMVPTPEVTTPTAEEDLILNKQISAVTVHGQIPTRDLMRRYNEEKGHNIRLARELLEKIRERQDVPIFFDVEEEDRELQAAEKRLADDEKQRNRLKQISGEYEELVHFVNTVSPERAKRAIMRFRDAYPDYGDPKQLAQQFMPSSLSLMAEPFEWIAIPGGWGTMKTNDSSVTLSIPTEPYWISKYPITNGQFAPFIEAGGYQTERWWTKEGWQKRAEGWHYDSGWKPSGKAWTEPSFWTDSTLNGAEQPVVGVSWYEAVAFCLWLSETTGETIMLPSEAQWQYAAQGDDGRAYPWGNDWNRDFSNQDVDKKGIGKTTPVRQYEGKGDSPFGVVDMTGNVWEWCLTDYDNKNNNIINSSTNHVVRGGSWPDSITDLFRCDFRSRNNRHYRYNGLGFRISRS